MEQVQKIEGISPDMIWTFLVVLVGLMALVVLGDKVLDVYRKAKKRREEQTELQNSDVTERIADAVMAKLEPKLNARFDEIDKKLSDDKELLASHTRQLNEHESRVGKLEGGTDTLCQGMLALLERDPALSRAAHAMQNYIITRRYNPADWEAKEDT